MRFVNSKGGGSKKGGIVDEVREGGVVDFSGPISRGGGSRVVDEVRKFEVDAVFRPDFDGGGCLSYRGRGGRWSFPARFFIFSVRNFGGVLSAGSSGGVQKFWGGPITHGGVP